MEKQQECHITVVKRVLRYIKDTIDHSVLRPRQKNTNTNAEVHEYIDSYFSGDQNEKNSTIDYLFIIGGTLISWSSRKQVRVALSSCEVEYVTTSYATCQALWIKMLLEELKITKPKKMNLFVDNKLAIDLANHPMCYDMSKNIERMYHFLKDQVSKGKLKLEC